MNINSVNFNNKNSYRPAFGHGNPWADSPYSMKERAVVAGTTALGVAGGVALLAKCAKYSLNPKKMFKNFKSSYIYKAPYDEKEIITIGAGSCLGGLAGVPWVTLPLAEIDGAPLGVSLVSGFGTDAWLLEQAGRLVERVSRR